jgi:hypothetical protein
MAKLIKENTRLRRLVKSKTIIARAKVSNAKSKTNIARAKANNARAKAINARAKANNARAKANNARAKANYARAKANNVRAKATYARANATKFKRKVENSPKSILDLPEETLLLIMTFLSLPVLYGSVALVCKKFCNLTRDPAVRRNVCFRDDHPIPTFARSFVVEAHHHLRELSLFRREDSNELVEVAALNCPNLKRLKIDECCTLTKSTISVLARSSVVSNLESVSFRDGNFCGAKIVDGSLRQLLESARNLRHLDLCGYDSLESKDMVNCLE